MHVQLRGLEVKTLSFFKDVSVPAHQSAKDLWEPYLLIKEYPEIRDRNDEHDGLLLSWFNSIKCRNITVCLFLSHKKNHPLKLIF